MKNISEIYNSAITLLIEADKKRDQTIVFYIALIALFVEFVYPLITKQPFIFIIINIIVIIFSIFIGLTIISLRKWHDIYTASAFVLRTLLIHNKRPNIRYINSCWQQYHNTEKDKEIHWFTRTENLIFSAFLTISTLPFITLFYGIDKILSHQKILHFVAHTPICKPLIFKFFVHIFGPTRIIFHLGFLVIFCYIYLLIRQIKKNMKYIKESDESRGWLLQKISQKYYY